MLNKSYDPLSSVGIVRSQNSKWEESVKTRFAVTLAMIAGFGLGILADQPLSAQTTHLLTSSPYSTLE